MCDFSPGGFLGFSGRGQAGFWINLGTLGWPGVGLSHVAPLARSPVDGEGLLVYESTSLASRPCCRRGVMIQGVQAHPYRERIDEYDGRVWYYAPKVPLTSVESVMFTKFLESQLGKPYDNIGAFRSRDLIIGWLWQWMFGEQDLASIFCSELLAAAEEHIDRFQANNASAWSPNRIGRATTTGWPFGQWGATPRFKRPQYVPQAQEKNR